MKIQIVNDVNKAILVIRNAGRWLEKSGKHPSKWWQLENLNRTFLLKYAKLEEFYVALVDGKPAGAAVLQFHQNAQDWESIDKGRPQPALYIHWLCVHRDFSGMGLPKIMVEFAQQYAKKKNVGILRVDTNADEVKLRKMYEDLGFQLVVVEQEDYRKTAYYQQRV